MNYEVDSDEEDPTDCKELLLSVLFIIRIMFYQSIFKILLSLQSNSDEFADGYRSSSSSDDYRTSWSSSLRIAQQQLKKRTGTGKVTEDRSRPSRPSRRAPPSVVPAPVNAACGSKKLNRLQEEDIPTLARIVHGSDLPASNLIDDFLHQLAQAKPDADGKIHFAK